MSTETLKKSLGRSKDALADTAKELYILTRDSSTRLGKVLKKRMVKLRESHSGDSVGISPKTKKEQSNTTTDGEPKRGDGTSAITNNTIISDSKSDDSPTTTP